MKLIWAKLIGLGSEESKMKGHYENVNSRSKFRKTGLRTLA